MSTAVHYHLSLLDALPISGRRGSGLGAGGAGVATGEPLGVKKRRAGGLRSSRPSATLRAWKARFATAAKPLPERRDRKSTRLNSSHTVISYAVFCLNKNR